MEAKILIRTPKGQASGTKEKMRKIIGIDKAADFYINDDTDDNEILYIVKGEPRRVMKVIKKAYLYPKIAQMAMDKKLMRDAMIKFSSRETYDQVYDMMINGTTVEVVKYNDYLEELKKPKGVFQKIKDKLGL